MPLESIIDNGSYQKKCKELGQKIFDNAKNALDENSFQASDVLAKICNAVCFNQNDNPQEAALRKQRIEHAWAGVGDTCWCLLDGVEL